MTLLSRSLLALTLICGLGYGAASACDPIRPPSDANTRQLLEALREQTRPRGVRLNALERVQRLHDAILAAAYEHYSRNAPPQVASIEERADGSLVVRVETVAVFGPNAGKVESAKLVEVSPANKVGAIRPAPIPYAVLTAVKAHAAEILAKAGGGRIQEVRWDGSGALFGVVVHSAGKSTEVLVDEGGEPVRVAPTKAR